MIQEVGTASCKYFNDDNSNIHKRKWHNKPVSNRQQFSTEMENRSVIAEDEKGGWQSVPSGCVVLFWGWRVGEAVAVSTVSPADAMQSPRQHRVLSVRPGDSLF